MPWETGSVMEAEAAMGAREIEPEAEAAMGIREIEPEAEAGMRIRRLAPEEHGKTKALYEEVFSEDKGAFADYYYEWKTRDNVIYVAEDEAGIYSMVQLNPFTVWVEGELKQLHYIVAVATQKEYRHRGLMRSLLTRAMGEMEQEGEDFTFLMPASEAIYLPFGFRYFSGQRKGILRLETGDGKKRNGRKPWDSSGGGETEKEGDGSGGLRAYARPILPEEYGMAARRVNQILAGSYRVFIWRDEAYYKRMEAELASQGGKLMGIFVEEELPVRAEEGGELPGEDVPMQKRRERLAGTYYVVRGEAYPLEIREVIAETEYLPEVEKALRAQILCSAGRVRRGCDGDWAVDCVDNASESGPGCGYVEESKRDCGCASESGSGCGYTEESKADSGSTSEGAACMVYGCPEGLELEEASWAPLLMARSLRGSIPEPFESIFINEIV